MSFVSSTGSWSSGFSGFGLSRPSSDPAALMYQSYKQLGKDLAGNSSVSVPQTTSLWVSQGSDTVAPKPLVPGTFANQYVSVLGALPTIETDRTLFGDEIPNSRLMQGLNKSYTGLSTAQQSRFLLKLKAHSSEIHQAFVEWNLLQSGLRHNNGLNPARFSRFVPSLRDGYGQKVQLQMWLNSLNSPHPAQFNFLQSLSRQLNDLYVESGRSEETLSRLIKPLVPWVGEQGAKDLVQTGDELFGDRPPVSGSTLSVSAEASNMSAMDSVPVHSAAMMPPVVGSTLPGRSKAAASNKSTGLTRGPGRNVVPVNVRVKQAIPVNGHVAVSKLAHQLIDAYEKRLASISVDVNKIRRDRDMLLKLAEAWQPLEPNLAATMRRLADHDSFDDSIRLNIDIQYGGSEQVKSPTLRRGGHNLWELENRTTYIDPPQGAFDEYVRDGDFAVERRNPESWVSPRNAEPIEIDLDSDFGRDLKRVLTFIGEVYAEPRTETEWTAVGQRLEQCFVSPECQNRPEIFNAALSLRQLASGDSTNSLVSDAFSLGFMTNKVVSILNSQPKPSPFVTRNSGMTPPPESAVVAAAASLFVSNPAADLRHQEPIFGLTSGSELEGIVSPLLQIAGVDLGEGFTDSQWNNAGIKVGLKFLKRSGDQQAIFARLRELYEFPTKSNEDPDIWGPLLDGIFSIDGVAAEYDRMESGAGSSGTSTPRSVLEVVSTPAAAGSRSLGNPLIQPVFHAGDGDDDGPLDEAATLRRVRQYINGSDDKPTDPIDWRAVGHAFRARVGELSSVNSPLSPSANLAIIQMALADIEHPSQDTKYFLAGYAEAGSGTNLPSQDESFGRIYELVPELFASERSAREPFFELGLNVRDALARYDHQIEGLGSSSTGPLEVNDSGEHGATWYNGFSGGVGISGSDSGEHGEISGRNSQLRAAVEELRKAPQTAHTRSFFAGVDSDTQGRSVTGSSFFVGQMVRLADFDPAQNPSPPSPVGGDGSFVDPIWLDPNSDLGRAVAPLLALADHDTYWLTATQWERLGQWVAQKFMDEPDSRPQIASNVRGLLALNLGADDVSPIATPILGGIFSTHGFEDAFRAMNSSPESSSSTSQMAQRILGANERLPLFGDGDDDLSDSPEEFVPRFDGSVNSLSPGVGRDVAVPGTQFDVGRPFGRSRSHSGSGSEHFAAVQRNLDADFEESPDVVMLPGENPGLSASASQAREERGSRVNPLSRVQTQGRILAAKDGVDSDAESEDSGFGDGLGCNKAASVRREVSVRNKQERLTGGDGMIVAGSPNTIAAKKPRRKSWISDLGIVRYLTGTKQEQENVSTGGKRASLGDADLGRESKEVVELTSPGKKTGGRPRLRQEPSQNGIELRNSSSGSGSNDSKSDSDDEA